MRIKKKVIKSQFINGKFSKLIIEVVNQKKTSTYQPYKITK